MDERWCQIVGRTLGAERQDIAANAPGFVLLGPTSAASSFGAAPSVTFAFARMEIPKEPCRIVDLSSRYHADAPVHSVNDKLRRDTLTPEMTEAIASSRLARVTDSQGVSIPVRVFGEDQLGVPAILLHGLQSHSGWFVQSGRAISLGGRPAYIVERRGSGQSDQPPGHAGSYMEMIDDIQTVVRHVMSRHGANRVHLVGHCFGAIPATAFACRNADVVCSLILPTPGINTFSDLSLWHKLRIALALLTGRSSMIPVPLQVEMFSDDRRYQDFIADDDLSLTHASASFYLQVPRARRFIARSVSHLTMPVFMATAARDVICDNERNRSFFTRLPAAQKQQIEYSNAVHILEFSLDRDRFFKDLDEWLRRTEQPFG